VGAVGAGALAMTRSTLAVIVLAAGHGTRMKSALPKVLHPICGLPMVQHVINAARTLDPAKLVVVVGHQSEQVRSALAAPDITFVEQTELLGTGDAVARCRDVLVGLDDVLVLNGDAPLLAPPLVAALAGHEPAPVTIVTAPADDAGRLGRVQRDERGAIRRIVEAADYEGGDLNAEINAGFYRFAAGWLWDHVGRLPVSPNGERYLTHLVAAAYDDGQPARSVTTTLSVVGVDDRVKLAEAERIMRARIIEAHQLAGVTISDPATTYIDASVQLAQDVTVLPNCYLHGTTVVERDCTIGPGTTLRNATIRQHTTVQSSVVEDSEIGARCRVGPFSHVRGGAVIGEDCELGNYSEVKNSRVGRRVKMHHFSYLGDADVGDETNIAAGAITCNWDGVTKHRTTIGARVFIGCDTMLIAPVSVGDDALTAAGSVVNRDVPAGVRVAGVPARPIPGKQD
jgi:bifunctional UDP-N-acetylglucosamine pyrophosphorylase/glucosamine-1-phosphate N-acetyltransferase